MEILRKNWRIVNSQTLVTGVQADLDIPLSCPILYDALGRRERKWIWTRLGRIRPYLWRRDVVPVSDVLTLWRYPTSWTWYSWYPGKIKDNKVFFYIFDLTSRLYTSKSAAASSVSLALSRMSGCETNSLDSYNTDCQTCQTVNWLSCLIDSRSCYVCLDTLHHDVKHSVR